MKKSLHPTRREIFSGAAALLAASLNPSSAKAEDILLDDASRLNATPVKTHFVASQNPNERLIADLRLQLKEARAARRPVAASAARHSMGGQSLPRGGTAITLNNFDIELDTAAKTCRVSAGARWKQVIAVLDEKGLSPKVMQSNNDFGVASTFCVNAHGWPAPFGPFGSTVLSFRMMMSDGEILTCSRRQNSDLFALSMGGYGLFGILIDLEIELSDNALLLPTFETMPAEALGERFVKALQSGEDIRMAFGRLNVTLGSFFDEALLVTFRPSVDHQQDLPRASSGGPLTATAKEIFRAQLGADYIKAGRWFVETWIGPWIGSGGVTRNSLLNEPVANLEGRDRSRSDILHEYFVPPERFADFIIACREVIPSSYQDLLNVTLRYVATDRLSVLSYAPGPRIAAVMLFSQEISRRADGDMRRMTQELIDRILALGGSYYLPYRLHARAEQLRKAYGNTELFCAKKRHYDPALLFRNAMWETYFAGI